MGLVNAVYSWPSVKALYLTVFSMNLAGMLALTFTLLWAVRFERGFGDYLNLIAPGDGHVWTAVIILAAIFCSPAYFLGIKCWLLLRLEPARGDLEHDQQRIDGAVDPHEANRLLFLHVVACLLSGFLIAILNATYFVLLSGFQQKSRGGLAEAIEKYSSDIAVKMRVDAVQTELECCGDNSYEDWFHVPWLKISVEGPDDSELGPRLEGQPVVEEREEESTTPVDVPFSCCSNDIPKPCVHHDILSPSAVYNYDPKHLTIATKGCRSEIINRAGVIRIYLAGYLALLSLYQMVLSVMARFLQTAHSNELYLGPQKTKYHAWIFFKPDDLSSRRSSHPRRKRSRQKLLTSSRKNSDQEDASTQRYDNRKSNAKVMTKIRSKISNVKSKSVPAMRSVFSSKDARGKKRSAKRLEEDIDEEEEKKLLPNRAVKSEVITNKDHRSVFSLISNDTSINLPPPPPPPPFSIALDVESEGERERDQTPIGKTDRPLFSRTENAVDDTFNRNIIANLNSGRRVKVLERFGAIWARDERNKRYRESGGADDSDGSRRSWKSACTKRKSREKFSSTDMYDRFRGTLQHTLARREAVRVRREFKSPAVDRSLNIRRNNVVARLKCNNVPPSYRLLANVEVQKRTSVQAPRAVPPPAPPLPPPPNPWTRNAKWARETKVLPRERRRRQCSICNRPVQQSPSSSGGSLVEPRQDIRLFRDPATRTPREDYAVWERSAFVSKPFQHR